MSLPILKWNGTAWAPQPSGTTKDFYGIWGSDANNIWAYGDALLKWNGTAWVAQQSGSGLKRLGAWGTSASNIWSVGDQGTILHKTQ